MKSIALVMALFAAMLLPVFGHGHSTAPKSAGTRSSAGRSRTTRSRTTRSRITRKPRSREARAAFMRQHPCPSTGRTSGVCPGYVVDHVKPLACGGADAPSNMQWQSVAEGKAKDKWERAGCGVR
jgi:hypothetical protein